MTVGMTFAEAIDWIKKAGLMNNEYTVIEEETEEEYGYIGLYFGDWEVRDGKIY